MGHGYSASGDFVGRWVVGWQGACGPIVSHSKLHTTFDELKIVSVSYPCEFSSLWRGGTTNFTASFFLLDLEPVIHRDRKKTDYGYI